MKQPTKDDLTEAMASAKPEFFAAVTDQLRDVIEAWLMMYGDPKEYREVKSFAHMCVDTTLLTLLSGGDVRLAKKHRATDEEKAASLAKAQSQAAREKVATRMSGQTSQEAGTLPLGAYL